MDQNPAVRFQVGVEDPHHHVAHLLSGTQRDHCRMHIAGEIGAVLPDGAPARIYRGSPLHLIECQAQDPLCCRIGRDDVALPILVDHALHHGLEE